MLLVQALYLSIKSNQLITIDSSDRTLLQEADKVLVQENRTLDNQLTMILMIQVMKLALSLISKMLLLPKVKKKIKSLYF